jgi:hypothetical protein
VGVNLYEYTLNNSINFIDRFGLSCDSWNARLVQGFQSLQTMKNNGVNVAEASSAAIETAAQIKSGFSTEFAFAKAIVQSSQLGGLFAGRIAAAATQTVGRAILEEKVIEYGSEVLGAEIYATLSPLVNGDQSECSCPNGGGSDDSLNLGSSIEMNIGGMQWLDEPSFLGPQ